MAHNSNCKLFKETIEMFMRIRPERWLKGEEYRHLLALTQPCHLCAMPRDSVSPLSGRLYWIVWEKYQKTVPEDGAKVLELFNDN